MTKVNLDKLQATDNGNIETVVGTVDLPNGALIALGEAIEDNREALEAVAPSATEELLLVAHPEVKYNQQDRHDELDYVTPAGKHTRAYHLTVGDKYQAEQVLFSVTPAKNDMVTGDPATYGYMASAGTERTTLKVERLTKFGWDKRDMALLRVVTV